MPARPRGLVAGSLSHIRFRPCRSGPRTSTTPSVVGRQHPARKCAGPWRAARSREITDIARDLRGSGRCWRGDGHRAPSAAPLAAFSASISAVITFICATCSSGVVSGSFGFTGPEGATSFSVGNFTGGASRVSSARGVDGRAAACKALALALSNAAACPTGSIFLIRSCAHCGIRSMNRCGACGFHNSSQRLS